MEIYCVTVHVYKCVPFFNLVMIDSLLLWQTAYLKEMVIIRLLGFQFTDFKST